VVGLKTDLRGGSAELSWPRNGGRRVDTVSYTGVPPRFATETHLILLILACMQLNGIINNNGKDEHSN